MWASTIMAERNTGRMIGITIPDSAHRRRRRRFAQPSGFAIHPPKARENIAITKPDVCQMPAIATQ